MFNRILRAIFCGSSFPVAHRCDVSSEGGEVIDDGHIYGIVDELATAEPGIVERYCDNVITGIAKYDDLAKALPLITSTACSTDYSSSDRIRIRNALKKVFFNVELEHTAQSNLFDAIRRISNA